MIIGIDTSFTLGLNGSQGINHFTEYYPKTAAWFEQYSGGFLTIADALELMYIAGGKRTSYQVK